MTELKNRGLIESACKRIDLLNNAWLEAAATA